MPWMLIFALLLFVVTAIAVIFTLEPDVEDGGKLAGKIVGGIVGFFAVMLFIWSFLAIVPTRNVGIVTSFGKPVSIMQNGLHAKLPWHHVSELDGTIQTDSQIGAFDQNGKCSNGTPVRLANNSTACADNTIRWRINPDAADNLFRDYQSNDNIRESLVTRELNATLNQVFATYNPLAADAAAGPNLADLSNQTTTLLQGKIGKQIEVQNVIISIIHFDGQTQEKINQYQSQMADTRIAQAKQQTATAEAAANQILSGSVSNDPNVLVSKCLDMIAAGKQFPVGFQCWPGAGLPVTIPAR